MENEVGHKRTDGGQVEDGRVTRMRRGLRPRMTRRGQMERIKRKT
jgi:hypothetical protein